jgi:hypothetical protein
MKNGRLFQGIHPVHCCKAANIAANEDIFNGDPASDVLDLSKYGNVMFLIVKSTGATGTATVTVESCDDATPSTATAVPFKYWTNTTGDTWSDMKSATASGFTTTAGADQMYAIEISAEALSTTDQHVRLQLTEVVDSPCDGAVLAIAGNPRYAGEVKPSALA